MDSNQTKTKSLRELIGAVELEFKFGDREAFESAVHELIANLKEDIYTVKWRQEPFEGLNESSTAVIERVRNIIDYEVVPESTGVWLYRTCGHCNHQELLGASHGSGRKTNRKEVLDILETVKEV